jgi:uncharacterized phiE125 gp8 family phage protein
MTALKLVTAPVVEPITILQAKQHLRVTGTDEDALILTLITAARGHAEAYTGRRFVTQTWDYFLDCFPLTEWYTWGAIEIPNAPLQSVTSVKYVDEAGVEQTIGTSDYVVDAKSDPGRIAPAYGKTWPWPRAQLNAVTIRFVCGYGLAPAVPYEISAAILLIIGELFKNREETVAGAILQEVPRGVESLLSPYRVTRF